MATYTSIDEYISNQTESTHKRLEAIRKLIHKIEPEAAETISYGIPTFDLNGKHLVHFAGYKNHIGFYPTPTGLEEFKEDLAGYETSKGTVQIPHTVDLPVDLITKIVKYRVSQVK